MKRFYFQKIKWCALFAVLIFASALIVSSQVVFAADSPKYVFLFIGDGMGLPQKMAAEKYIGKKLVMNSLSAHGVTTTNAADRFITGSAAAATAIATGMKTNIGFIGMDSNQKPLKSIAQIAKEKGMKAGIVTSVSIDHATPAAFYANVPSRSQYYDIAVALAKSGFDYFGGGGMKDPANKRENSLNFQGDALELAKKNGYRVVTKKQEFLALKPSKEKILAYNEWLQDGGALSYALDMREQDISLAEFTAKGIELLDNPKGFFMMVEGGKIDWACHANDGAASIHDTLAFDEAVKHAYDFYKAHPKKTLIVVTGDHETGGMALGFAGTRYESNFKVLNNQSVSFQRFGDEILAEFKKKESNKVFDAIKPLITKYFGLKFDGGTQDSMVLQSYEIDRLKSAFERSMAGDTEEKSYDPEVYLLYGGYDPLSITLTHILNQKAGMAWTSYKHTAVPIATSAAGLQAEAFNGYYDNTDIALKIMSIMGSGDKPVYEKQSQNQTAMVQGR
ncbi:MAG: alkaline phosphatase [Desulfobacteraceae bacterium]|nr:alkaline phosphatase [Desulfobacteraceae bacterium]